MAGDEASGEAVALEVKVVVVEAAEVVVDPLGDVAAMSRRRLFDGPWVYTQDLPRLVSPGGDCTPLHTGVYQASGPL